MFFSWPKFSGSEQASLGINCGRRLIPSSFVVSKVILMDSFDFTFCNTIISINNLLLPEWILYMISTGVDPNLENSGTAVWAGTREAAFMANVKSTFRWFLQRRLPSHWSRAGLHLDHLVVCSSPCLKWPNTQENGC